MTRSKGLTSRVNSFSLFFVGALLAIVFALSTAQAAEAAPKVLVFTGGATNGSVSAATTALNTLGTAEGFEVTASSSAADFTAANLAQYRGIVLLHNTGTPFTAAQQTALIDYVNNGGGLLTVGEGISIHGGVTGFNNLFGIASATRLTNVAGTPSYTIEAGDRVHPATKGLPVTHSRTGQWYSYPSNPTGTSHVVARIRTGNQDLSGDGTTSNTRPIAWCRDQQNGRTFYTGLGGSTADWTNANFLKHIDGAIEWTAGMTRAGCKATINSNYSSTRLSNRGTGLQFGGESHGLSIGSNGLIVFIGRADCVDNSERGARVNPPVASQGRITDWNNPNVGVGCGSVHVFDPAAYTGSQNSGVTRAGTLAVFGDMGTSDEAASGGNYKPENGLLGVTVAPDFATTGHVYLQYFPTLNPNTTPPGLSDGAQRRISKMGKGRISRFTLNLATKQLDMSSEVKIFEYETQIFSCCHVGGGMGFDSAGNLYITTGDSNSSAGNYMGGYQNITCPTGTPTEATGTHCGANGVSYRDARRTAGNTNDYNGKMLRIKPIPTATPSTPIGIGSTYSIPTAADPNGANLFSGTEGNGSQAKPEIYAMGLRNPSRLNIDPSTDIPYSAWVGPDASGQSTTQGPAKYETAARMRTAGNYGWPYCMGGSVDSRPQGYRDIMPNGSLRTSNTEAGNTTAYVNGGGGTAGWHDCDNIRNDSVRNTGLTGALPHSTGTGKDAGKALAANLWYAPSGGGGGCADFTRTASGVPNYGTATSLCPYVQGGGQAIMAGPIYDYNGAAADNTRRWPKYWDGRWFLGDESGGENVRHGLLIEDGAAGDGKLPAYADNMKSIITWSNGAWMDAKFGPDGAFYLQTYDGFFRAGGNVGLTRIAYNGGPDTPNISPTWTAGAQSRSVAFSPGRSGGVSYAWDFDNNGSTDSTAEAPTHQYPTAGNKVARLTVTYGDGETQTTTLNVVASDSDDVPPVTTHTLNPVNPPYSSPVTVTLSATDPAPDASGVLRTEYRHGTDGSWETYTAPFQITGSGAKTVQYRSIDNNNNTETIKVISITLTGGSDSTAPTTTHTLNPAAPNGNAGWYTSDVKATLAATDNAGGTGVQTVQYRINGGAWTNYNTGSGTPTETTILNSAANLSQWLQAGPGSFQWNTADGGFARSVGGMGMAWFPTEYGDFHLKMQWRDSSTGTNGNAGVLIRFPDPRIPLAQRPATYNYTYQGTPYTGTHCSRDGSAATAQEWVAINCGHEIQVNDHQTDTIKTGSVYAFKNLNATQAQTQPRGTWVNYEIKAIGQQYEIIRNGVTINTFDNAVPLSSSGRPPTQARQFARGYIGLQNHGNNDVMDFRNITITSLDNTAEELTLSSAGDNTIEYRAVDVAGNIETVKSTPVVKIDKTAPTSSASLAPASPGAGGTYTGQVNVSLSGDDVGGAVASGLSRLEYRIGTSGAFTPYTTPVNFNTQGSHTLQFRAVDNAGNNQATQSVSFSINTGGTCTDPKSDNFEGTSLDPKWETVNGGTREVSGGKLHLQTIQGDVSAAAFSANIIQQTLPSGPWTITAKMDASTIDNNGVASGIHVWSSGSSTTTPRNHSKMGVQYKTTDFEGGAMNGIWHERLLVNNSANNTAYGNNPPGGNHNTYPNSGKLTPVNGELWIRTVFDGTNITPYHSLDGSNFVQTAPPFPVSVWPAGPMKFGLFAKHDAASTQRVVSYESFTVESGATNCPPPGGNCNVLSDPFNGTSVDAKWDQVRPSPSSPVAVADGHLRMPLIVGGDFYGNQADVPWNTMMQDAPATGSWVATAKVKHAGIDSDGKGAGVALINNLNPNYYIKSAVQFKADADPVTAGAQPGKWAERVLTSNGVAIQMPDETVPYPNSGALSFTGDYVWVRLVYDETAGEYSTWTSLNGTSFIQYGANLPDTYLNQNGGQVRVGVFGKRDAQGSDGLVEIDAFNIVGGTANPQTAGDDCGTGPGGACTNESDMFTEPTLGNKWEVINPNATDPLVLANGHLNIPILPGDIYLDRAIAANTIVQPMPAGNWVATAKINHTEISSDGRAAGLALINNIAPNYVAKSAVQYKNDVDPGTAGNQPGKWAERVMTINNQSQILPPDTVAWPNSGALNPPTEYVWVRIVRDTAAGVYSTWTSVNGTTFTKYGTDMPAAPFNQNDGLMKIGVFAKHDGTGRVGTVPVDAFNIVLGTSDPQTPGDACGGGTPGETQPPVTSHTLNPATPNGSNSWYTSAPQMTLSATDNVSTPAQITTEWRYGTSGAWTAYTGPVSLSNQGDNLVVQYRSTDAAANVETPKQFTVKNDFTAPVSTAALTPGTPNGPGGTWLPGASLTINATDATSGVGQRQYRIGTEGAFTNYTTPVVFNDVGAYTVQYRTIDNAGNTETTKQIQFAIQTEGGGPDTVAPVSSAQVSSSLTGLQGWHRAAVTVTLSAIDPDENASGVDVIEYRLGSSGAFSEYTGPIAVSADGEHVVQFRARDEAGNTETPHNSVTFKIDKTVPTTSASLSSTSNKIGDVYSGPVKVTLNPTDAGSGVAGTIYRIDGGSYNNASSNGVTISTSGTHTVEFYSLDVAGNQEAVKTETFVIDTTLAPKVAITMPSRISMNVSVAKKIKVKVRNTGGTAATNVKVCLKVSKSKATVKPKCKTVKTLGAGKTKKVVFRVTLKKPGNTKLKVDARAANAPRDKASGMATGKR